MTRAFAKLRRTLGRSPIPAELAAELGWPEERLNSVKEAHRVTGPLQSTSAPIGEEGDMELGDIIAADEETRPDVAVLGRHEAAQARTAILQAVELLPERWRIVLALRLVQGRTLEATAEGLGVTRERVRQIETRVIARLREALRYDARALNLIGLEVTVPATVTSPDADGFGVSDIAILTGLSQRTLEAKIAAGSFPEPDRHVHHRGTRLWDPEAVAEWMAHRDAASAPTAAEEASPGTSSPDTAEAAPRPPCAPALAHSLMGGCSFIAVFAARSAA
jgi:RNA polymerase sigma factor (sigma-70 family)